MSAASDQSSPGVANSRRARLGARCGALKRQKSNETWWGRPTSPTLNRLESRNCPDIFHYLLLAWLLRAIAPGEDDREQVVDVDYSVAGNIARTRRATGAPIQDDCKEIVSVHCT